VTNDDFVPTTPKNRSRLLERLDHMVRSGQVTSEEATAIRGATNTEDFEAAVIRVRARHARARLDAAVETGQMTRAEADTNMAQLQKGEHPGALRAQLRKMTSKDH
jgi:hypothetical protein